MGEEYKKFLEAVKLQEEKDTYSILTEKYKKIACIKKNWNKKMSNMKYINIAKKIDMCLIFWAYEWNEKRMSSISMGTDYMALNQLNEDPNYKGISRDIKARFDKYCFHYNKKDDKEDNSVDYYFEDEDYLWKTTLFDTLGIKFYVKDKSIDKYILETRFPRTEYIPVYFALFRSINNNIFFQEPDSKANITETNFKRFYKGYYEFLNKKIKDKDSGEANYWLSEKMFGINFIKKLVEKLEEFKEVYSNREILILKKSRYQDNITKNLADLINTIIQIDEPELRILYLDIFIDVDVDLRESREYIDEIKEHEIIYLQSKNNQNKKSDTVQNKTSTARKKIDWWKEDTLKKIIETIQEEPDLAFLDDKKYKDHFIFICKNTEWLSKFIYPKEDPKEEINSYGYYIEEQ